VASLLNNETVRNVIFAPVYNSNTKETIMILNKHMTPLLAALKYRHINLNGPWDYTMPYENVYEELEEESVEKSATAKLWF